MKIRYLALAASAAIALAAPGYAHDQWLKPSVTVLSDTTQSVTVDAGTSTIPFQPNHQPMNVENMQVVRPDGTAGAIENTARGRYRTTFDVKIDMPGTWRIGNSSSNLGGSFKVDGADWRIGRRRGPPAGAPGAAGAPPGAGPGNPPAGAGGPGAGAGAPPANMVATADEIPAGATDIQLTESHSRNEFFVTAGNPTEQVYTPTGSGLEFVPQVSPTDLVMGEPAQFQYLVDGQPAVGVEVTVIADGQRYHSETYSMDLTTDANGMINIDWPVAGFYWLSAQVEDEKPSDARANKRRMTYIATLEVVAP